MREKCWRLLFEAYYYYNCSQWYYSRLSHIKTGITILTTVGTAASITAWTIWQKIPTVWAVIVGLAQLAQAVYPETPWNKRIEAMKKAVLEYGKFAASVENFWNCEGTNAPEGQDQKLLKKYTELKTRMQVIDSKYLPTERIRLRKRVRAQMEKRAARYLMDHCS
ncbi:MAG: hypothetical protein PHY64_11935 [Eubacteriales bacterium]|nr:hypothetical protein [Eubacteriales bacterium]